MSHNSDLEPFTLYHNYWSGCSLQVRFTIAVSPPHPTFRFIEKEVNIQSGEQMQEWFLDINPKGQVPVLTHPTLFSAPMPDSVDITVWLYQHYPNLRPAQHAETIDRLLDYLHKIDVFTLTFAKNPERAAGLRNGVKALLAAPDLSEKYRKQLEFKTKIVETTTAGGFSPEYIASVEEKVKKLADEVASINAANPGSKWMFGTEHATALDAHLIVIWARLRDVGRSDLHGASADYFNAITEDPAWKDFMQGRSTMYGKPPT